MVFNQHKQTKEDLLWRLREKNSQHFRCFRTECKTPRNSEGKKKKKKFRERKPTLSSSLYPASVGQWFRGHRHSLTSFIKRASVSPWFCYCGRNKLAAGLSACFDSALLLFHCRTQADIQRHSSWAVMCVGPGTLAVSLIELLNDCALIQKQPFLTLCNLLELLCILYSVWQLLLCMCSCSLYTHLNSFAVEPACISLTDKLYVFLLLSRVFIFHALWIWKDFFFFFLQAVSLLTIRVRENYFINWCSI